MKRPQSDVGRASGCSGLGRASCCACSRQCAASSRQWSRSCLKSSWPRRRSAMTPRSSATRVLVVMSVDSAGASRGTAALSPSVRTTGGKTRCSSPGSTCHPPLIVARPANPSRPYGAPYGTLVQAARGGSLGQGVAHVVRLAAMDPGRTMDVPWLTNRCAESRARAGAADDVVALAALDGVNASQRLTSGRAAKRASGHFGGECVQRPGL